MHAYANDCKMLKERSQAVTTYPELTILRNKLVNQNSNDLERLMKRKLYSSSNSSNPKQQRSSKSSSTDGPIFLFGAYKSNTSQS